MRTVVFLRSYVMRSRRDEGDNTLTDNIEDEGPPDLTVLVGYHACVVPFVIINNSV